MKKAGLERSPPRSGTNHLIFGCTRSRVSDADFSTWSRRMPFPVDDYPYANIHSPACTQANVQFVKFLHSRRRQSVWEHPLPVGFVRRSTGRATQYEAVSCLWRPPLFSRPVYIPKPLLRFEIMSAALFTGLAMSLLRRSENAHDTKVENYVGFHSQVEIPKNGP